MRLIHAENFAFEEFFGDQIPEYAIISHRWTNEEVSYEDFKNKSSTLLKGQKQSYGWIKIKKACEIAKWRGYEWVWLDSCCIDKKSSAELTEAINSMYNWYERSAECYVFLRDVHDTGVASKIESQWRDKRIPDFQYGTRFTHDQFRSSVWFTRSWTLQELLAPRQLYFFNSDFSCFASKKSQAEMISAITGIPRDFLHRDNSSLQHLSISKASVADRMRWASHRQATRKEDVAYSLLGLFDINMPLLYGEEEKAFHRLQIEIIRKSSDETILAWSPNDMRWRDEIARSSWMSVAEPLLAPQPSAFSACPQLRLWNYVPRQHYEVTNKGLRILLPLSKPELAMKFGTRGDKLKILWKLNCIAFENNRDAGDERSLFILANVRPQEAIASEFARSPRFDFLMGERTGLEILSTAELQRIKQLGPDSRPDIIVAGQEREFRGYEGEGETQIPVYFATGWEDTPRTTTEY